MDGGGQTSVALLPNAASARLPATYEAAKLALASCSQIDECREWANRMEALASYARQSEDDTLLKAVQRIKARAIERCGELLREIPQSRGRQPENGGAAPRFTRSTAAREAKLSPDQAKTAMRVANIPKKQFELLVESDNPPTIEALAELGTQHKPTATVIDHLGGRDPNDFEQATRLLGLARLIVERANTIDLIAAGRGLHEDEKATLATNLDAVSSWIREVRNHALQPR